MSLKIGLLSILFCDIRYSELERAAYLTLEDMNPGVPPQCCDVAPQVRLRTGYGLDYKGAQNWELKRHLARWGGKLMMALTVFYSKS